jgi:phosphoribosylglycinamide formyltransferase-1
LKRIAILASGNGSNAVRILQHFYTSESAKVVGVFSNKMNARVLEKFIDRDHAAYFFESNEELLEQLQAEEADYVVLAGYLKLIPLEVLSVYKNAIINIHPALLPKYGGAGMYGVNVHKAVKASGESETGVTIHLVNEVYDGGRVLFQAATAITENDSAKDIARKVQALEHEHYPLIIEKLINDEF